MVRNRNGIKITVLIIALIVIGSVVMMLLFYDNEITPQWKMEHNESERITNYDISYLLLVGL